MILIDLPNTTVFRAHTPKYSFQPTSGAGAAKQGGRFNRKDVDALYLSFEQDTAIKEYQQTSPFLPPCILCSYAVKLTKLVDLRQLHHGPPWDDLWHDWHEDWRELLFDQQIEPPSWILSDMVIECGYTGIVFPSITNTGGNNLVVFCSQLNYDNSVSVNDPTKLLPQNQKSWL